jgi:hypothetical protein
MSAATMFLLDGSIVILGTKVDATTSLEAFGVNVVLTIMKVLVNLVINVWWCF